MTYTLKEIFTYLDESTKDIIEDIIKKINDSDTLDELSDNYFNSMSIFYDKSDEAIENFFKIKDIRRFDEALLISLTNTYSARDIFEIVNTSFGLSKKELLNNIYKEKRKELEIED